MTFLVLRVGDVTTSISWGAAKSSHWWLHGHLLFIPRLLNPKPERLIGGFSTNIMTGKRGAVGNRSSQRPQGVREDVEPEIGWLLDISALRPVHSSHLLHYGSVAAVICEHQSELTSAIVVLRTGLQFKMSRGMCCHQRLVVLLLLLKNSIKLLDKETYLKIEKCLTWYMSLSSKGASWSDG